MYYVFADLEVNAVDSPPSGRLRRQDELFEVAVELSEDCWDEGRVCHIRAHLALICIESRIT